MELDFTSYNPNSLLIKVIEQLKRIFPTQKTIYKNITDECVSIVPKKLRKHLLIIDKNGTVIGIQSNHYEFWIYSQIKKRLESGEIHLDDSISHRCFENELVQLNDDKIDQFDLPCLQKPIDEQLNKLSKELKIQWELFDKMIKSNKLKHIQYDIDSKTVSFHKLKTNKVEESENIIYSKLPSVDIIDVLRFVNKKCGFLSAFNPVQSRYTKGTIDEESLLAVIIAQAMNHGNSKLSKISDIPYKRLIDVYYQYFRKLTLHESNKIISNAMKELPIFQYYSFDLTTLYGSVDGQKMGVEYPTIKARHSKKYFGRGRGMVSYGMLVNHNHVMGDTIGTNEHESYFVFDIYYNNMTDIIPDAITGDMHSINKANFAILHWFNVHFRPRFTNLETQLKHLYCYDELENYNDYYIKPVGQIDIKLIAEEWDKIKQIILTLATKETTQSKIIKKLCTYRQNRTLKAIFEFDKLVRSIYTLKYLMDPNLQQNVHRSQNRIESFHQLRAAISRVNGKKQLIGKTDIEIDVSNQCGRLIANAIVYYNSVLLSHILEKYQSCNNTKAIEKLKKISPVAWQHIHLLGRYMFYGNKNPVDLEKIVSVLEIA
jgi:TnpA family transposase